MTVVALKDGGLWVHSPVAPTVECVRLLRELEDKYGDVKYIVLPTYAVEHKACSVHPSLTAQASDSYLSSNFGVDYCANSPLLSQLSPATSLQ